jgi:DNA repair protein RecN (Recombination protein N)
LLSQLKIKNYALIDDLEVSFSDGMTCITGETGAGKSILLGGLSLVLGKRADLSSLLDPNKKCIVEATFEVANYQLKVLFDELAVDYDSTTILRREILPQGKSRAFINDTPVTLSTLEQISKRLLDIHSQNDTQILLENEYQFQVLDALAHNQSDIEDYLKTLIDYEKTIKDYDYLLSAQSRSKESLELKQFLFDELDFFDLELGMYEKFEEKLASLYNVDYIQITIDEAIQLLESEYIGIVDQLFRLRNLSNGLFEKSNQFSSFKERIQSLTLESEDVLEECKRQLENLEVNPNELEELTKKIDQLNVLFQKHKVNSVEELIEIKKELKQDIQKTEDLDTSLHDLSETQKKQERLLEGFAKSISEKRYRAVSILEDELKSLVGKMGMKDAFFKIELSPSETYLSNGKDHLYFL